MPPNILEPIHCIFCSQLIDILDYNKIINDDLYMFYIIYNQLHHYCITCQVSFKDETLCFNVEINNKTYILCQSPQYLTLYYANEPFSSLFEIKNNSIINPSNVKNKIQTILTYL